MMEVLLKSSLSLIVLYIFYRLLIRTHTTPRVRRYFLLFALCAGICIPFLNVELWTASLANSPVPVSSEVLTGSHEAIQVLNKRVDETRWLSTTVAWVYAMGFALLILRFCIGLVKIYLIKKRAEERNFRGQSLFICREAQPAFSFFSHVFVSEETYQNHENLPIILEHENAHVAQKHTLDILFVHVFRAIFWFNPVMYLFKREIELNIEYLADYKACETFDPLCYLQALLNHKVSRSTLLASQFVKHPIKSRVEEIAKVDQKKKRNPWTSLSLTIPILLGLIFILGDRNEIFSVPEVAVQETSQETTEEYCECPHIHMTNDNKVIVIEQGLYGPVERLENVTN